jgi:hypothetical protein
MKNFSGKTRRENQETHFRFSAIFRKLADYEIMWKNYSTT